MQELNKKVQEDAHYLVPEGFKKVAEKEFKYHYDVPAYLEISEAQRISIKLLDEILADKIGIHILEAQTEERMKYKVKAAWRTPSQSNTG